MSSQPGKQDPREAHILESWQRNAAPWVSAVRGQQIVTRQQITNRAMIDAVLDYQPQNVLDIGCGEGWLSRALAEHGIRSLGVDAIPALIDSARQWPGDYRLLRYEDLTGAELGSRFDCAICNFSLLGESSTEAVFRALPTLLAPGGIFILQTLHPVAACGAQAYEDGWREGSWDGFSSAFSHPAPWYFRTLESWHTLFPRFGLTLLEQREPSRPEAEAPQSLLLIARVNSG